MHMLRPQLSKACQATFLTPTGEIGPNQGGPGILSVLNGGRKVPLQLSRWLHVHVGEGERK